MMVNSCKDFDSRYLRLDTTNDPLTGGLTLANLTNALNSGDYTVQMLSGITDGAGAIGYILDTTNDLTIGENFVVRNAGTDLLSIAKNLSKFTDQTLWMEGTTGATPTSGAGTRLMWIPAKGAFRAGIAVGTEWDDANIGSQSAVFGQQNTGSGQYSFVGGLANTGSGLGSTTFGTTNTNASLYGLVSGSFCTPTGNYTNSFGLLINISGDYSMGQGQSITISGDSSFAQGTGHNVQNAKAAAFGASNTITDTGAGLSGGFLAGQQCTITDALFATGLGFLHNLTGDGAVALGGSVSVGGNTVSGDYALASGANLTSSNAAAITFGRDSTNSGNASIVSGRDIINTGNQSALLGRYLSNTFLRSFIIGEGVGVGSELATTANRQFIVGFSSTTPQFLVDATHTESQGVPHHITNGNEIRFYDSGDSNYVGFNAPALTGNQLWTLPSTDGTANQFLKTNASGVLSWGGDISVDTITIGDAQDIIAGTTTGTTIATTTAQKIGLWGAAPVIQPTALTAALTQITHTGPTTPDYAIATPIDSGIGSAWGFSTQDEFETAMSVILNLQTRVDELESKLQSFGAIA